MKKILSMVLALTMAVSMAACAPAANNDETTTTPVETTTEPAPVAASALEILETAWSQVPEKDKFPVMGGDYAVMADGKPGVVTDQEFMSGVLLVSAEETENVTEVAGLVHGMMLNNFTCGAFKVADAAAFAEAMHTAIANNPWMCGMPEKMVIAVIGDYVVAMFGVNDAVNPMETALTAAYPTANLVYSEAITG